MQRTRFKAVTVALAIWYASISSAQAPLPSQGPETVAPDASARPLPLIPEVNAQSAIILDEVSGKVLWSKDPDTQRFPASTTKIMTALLLIERCLPDEVIVAPKDIEKIGGASLHLKPGERVTVKEMLHAIMLRSANDGCVAAAVHIAGSVEAFSKLMNDRARQIGCKNTRFNNPNGLNDDLHVTTARDLALIAREAMKYPVFRDIVKKRKYTISRSVNVKDVRLVSKNKYLDMDPTADGIKTGFTNPAGHCFVGSATRDGYRLITVVLKSEDWKKDHAALLDWGFGTHERALIAKAGQEVAKLEVEGARESVPVTVPQDAYQVLAKKHAANLVVQPFPDRNIEAPIKQGQKMGVIRFSDEDGWEQTLPMVALISVDRGTSPFTLFLLVGGVGSGAYWLKKRTRRGGVFAKTRKRKARRILL